MRIPNADCGSFRIGFELASFSGLITVAYAVQAKVKAHTFWQQVAILVSMLLCNGVDIVFWIKLCGERPITLHMRGFTSVAAACSPDTPCAHGFCLPNGQHVVSYRIGCSQGFL